MTTRFVIFRRKIFVNYGSQMCKNVLQKFCKPEIQLRVKFLEEKRDLKFQQDFLAHILWSPCLKVYWFLSKLIILEYIHIRQAQLQSYVSSIIMKNHKFFLCLYGLLHINCENNLFYFLTSLYSFLKTMIITIYGSSQ